MSITKIFLLYWTIREPHSIFSKFRNFNFEEYLIFFSLVKFLYSQPTINDLWRFQSQKIKIQSHLRKLVKYFCLLYLIKKCPCIFCKLEINRCITQLYSCDFHTPIGNVTISQQLHQFHASNLLPIGLFNHAISLILQTFSDPY